MTPLSVIVCFKFKFAGEADYSRGMKDQTKAAVEEDKEAGSDGSMVGSMLEDFKDFEKG